MNHITVLAVDKLVMCITNHCPRHHKNISPQGPTPSIGDKVQYEAQRTTAASHWNATKVKVVQFAVPHAKQGPEPVSKMKFVHFYIIFLIF